MNTSTAESSFVKTAGLLCLVGAVIGVVSGLVSGCRKVFQHKLVCPRNVTFTELSESRSLLDFVMVGVTLGGR